MSTIHVSDSIPAYALGILEEAEQAVIQSHLGGCATCQAELRAYQLVVAQLPAAVPQRLPPVRLRASILQHAITSTLQPGRAGRVGWLAWLKQPFSPLVGWLALMLIFVMGGINLSLWQQTQHPAAPTNMAGEFRLVQMAPPQSGHASGLLVISDEGSFGTLVVDGLEQLGSSKQYQLWLIKDGKRTSGGVFSVQDNGYGALKIDSPLPLSQYQSFGITIEPFGGSPGPTGPKVLGGSL